MSEVPRQNKATANLEWQPRNWSKTKLVKKHGAGDSEHLHVQTLIMYKLGFNEDYYTLT